MSKRWYILNTYAGYEGKIERTVRTLLDKGELDSSVITDVKVPVEEIVEIKDGKRKTRKDKLLPGYLMLEMDLPEVDWKSTCSRLRRIVGVSGFVGTDANVRPRPISTEEVKRLLQKSGDIKGEKPVKVKQAYSIGDTVKINDGPFASFSGNIEEIYPDREKLIVNVQIFGRATPVEVGMLQVEKVN